MRKLFLGLAIPLALLISSIGAIVGPTLATHAVNGIYTSASDSDKVEMWKYARRMYLCYSNTAGKDQHTGVDMVSGGNIFKSGNLTGAKEDSSLVSDSFDTGALKKNMSETVSCGDGDNALAKSFFQLFGITDRLKFVCELGYDRIGSSNLSIDQCVNGSGGFDTPVEALPGNFKSYMISNFNLDVTHPDKYTHYKLYSDVLFGICIQQPAASTISSFTNIPTDRQYSVAAIGTSGAESGSLIQNKYYGAVSTDTPMSTYWYGRYCGVDKHSSTNVENQLMLTNAAFTDYYNSLKTKAETWCKASNGGALISSEQVAACVVGSLSSTGDDPCTTKYVTPVYTGANADHVSYPDNQNKSACTAGRDNASIDITGLINSNTPDITNGTTTCAIDGIGWILCPVVNFLAKISDQSYEFLKNNFLETKSSLFADGNGTYEAWGVMRSIANVVFVIAFLIIIFSQLTSAGISSYGVKKMLPRLVIAAILVNISYFVCQIAVDISNILGYSLNSTLSGIVQAHGNAGGAGSTGAGLAGVAGGLLAGAATIALAYAMLSSLVGVLIAGVIALLMILFMLVARQALIVLLVVVSPLAFVAFLLPNTEEYFKKWRKMFVALLMLFPIIAVVYGLSTLASNILANAFTLSSGKDNYFGSIIAAAVAILPLFIVPGLLKKSLDGAGTIGAKLNNLGSKAGGAANKGIAKTRAGEAMKAFDSNRITNKANRRSKQGGWQNKLDSSKVGRTLGFSAGAARASQISDAADQEELKNAHSRMNGMQLTTNQKKDLALGRDVVDSVSGKTIVSSKDGHMRRAAIEQFTAVASVPEANELLDASKGMDFSQKKSFMGALAQSSAAKKASWLGGKTFGDIEEGKGNSAASMTRAIEAGNIDGSAIIASDPAALKALADHALTTPFGSRARSVLKQAEADFRANPQNSDKIAAGSDKDLALDAFKSL